MFAEDTGVCTCPAYGISLIPWASSPLCHKPTEAKPQWRGESEPAYLRGSDGGREHSQSFSGVLPREKKTNPIQERNGPHHGPSHHSRLSVRVRGIFGEDSLQHSRSSLVRGPGALLQL
uniref:Uncharacterized protein n=1 Tax=Chrysemys picta bellii TaxID=8478 RepID=A0A8C3I9B3_CHRPI